MARITRKELKTDKFALEVGHTVDYFEEHRQAIVRYGAAALVVVLLALGIYFYRKHQHSVREQALGQALQVLEAPTGQAAASAAGLSFPTGAAKEQEASKRFAEIAAKYDGTKQGAIAEYTLGSMALDNGRMQEAEKRFQTVAESGTPYAALGKLSLAELYFSTNRVAQGEKLARELMDKPSAFVSKEEATLSLARGIMRSKPAEARKLVEPLRASRSTAVSQAAIQLFGEIPQS